jgi:phosphatidylserine/phosphatidylglycerophosphate/cardiolipin synthase-like enzyme
VLVAPDNAEDALVRRLDRADTSIRVLQVSVGSRSQPFLRAAVRAARRGVAVRVLLSSAWYVAEENRALVERLNALATREDLPLSARVASPRRRFGKVHAKGVVVDDTVVLGSLNWNNHSARENREVLVALEGERVAGYYRRGFDADWRQSGQRLPVGLPVVLAVAAGGCLLAARRLEFEG